MADLEEITETPRTDIDSDSNNEGRASTRRNSPKRKRSKNRRNSSGLQTLAQTSPPDQVFDEKHQENGGIEKDIPQPAKISKKGATPTQEDHRARFFEDYRKVAEEYDKAFLKKHDEDLNTTLIFAGLFSAVTSAFIIQFDAQLQPDSGDEAAALLRLILYRLDNTSFGTDVPTLPQWTGPPHTVVQVQAILFASLAASLLVAFLAVLGKQWLNRYESTTTGRSAIERSQNRQQKLGGVVGWYFDHVMQLLPLMLQTSLLLLGCALTRYLWDVNRTIASVIACVTAFGLAFYLFIVIAGTIFEHCPYQTPAALVSRHILQSLRTHLQPALHSASVHIPIILSSTLSRLYHASQCCHSLLSWWSAMKRPWHSKSNITNTLLLPPLLFYVVAIDVFWLARATIQSVIALTKTLYQKITGGHRAYIWFTRFSLRTLALGQQTIMMDLHCISWILQTSLDKVHHLSAFRHLISIPDLVHLHPALVAHCFNIFTGCVKIIDGKAVVTQGLEDLAPVSAQGFLRTLRFLATMNPTSHGLVRLQRHYKEVFPSEVDFSGLPPEFQSTMEDIHNLAGRFGNPRDIQWNNHGKSVKEHIPFIRGLVETAREKYEQTHHRKVPRWILRSVLYFLSLGPLSPPSVVADCLTIIAIDLDCDIPHIVISDDWARTEHISNLIIQKLETWARAGDSDSIISNRKAINTLFPYAIFLEQRGKQAMIDAVLHTARAANLKKANCGKFMWYHVVLYISRLFETQSPNSLNRVITLISPYVPWGGALNNKVAVARWAEAASAIPYTEEVGQNVIDALFQIAFVDLLRAHIPIEMWRWMKRRPPLPPMYQGLLEGPRSTTVAYVRTRKDIDLLKSYFLLVWTDRCVLLAGRIYEVESSIREDFVGKGMEHHRRDLMDRLDHVLDQLDRRSSEETPEVQEARTQYAKIRNLLVEIDEK